MTSFDSNSKKNDKLLDFLVNILYNTRIKQLNRDQTMLHVIYNKETGKTLRARARSVGCFITNYKTESAAKAALTRLDKKGKLGVKIDLVPAETKHGMKFNERVETPYVKDDFAVADVDTFREIHPIKMVERVNMMSGRTYMEAEDTPDSCSPASELYWTM